VVILTPIQKRTLENIKKWLMELNIFEFQEIQDEENAFTIDVRPKSKPSVYPIQIIGFKQEDDKIMLMWLWGFVERDRNSLRMIDMNVKKKFESDLKYGLELLGLPLRFYESIEDTKGIWTGKYIKVDELSKEKLLKVITQLGNGATLIGQKFEKYFPLPHDFDPSFHV
jgi:hypothetical protein